MFSTFLHRTLKRRTCQSSVPDLSGHRVWCTLPKHTTGHHENGHLSWSDVKRGTLRITHENRNTKDA